MRKKEKIFGGSKRPSDGGKKLFTKTEKEGYDFTLTGFHCRSNGGYPNDQPKLFTAVFSLLQDERLIRPSGKGEKGARTKRALFFISRGLKARERGT